MITYVADNLFKSPARVLVNTVNTVGVMGKGIAKEFKTIFPEMFKQYQKLCETGELAIGKLWLYKTPHKWVLNFPTKTTWRNPSKIEYIEAGLKAFVHSYAQRGITSIAFPPLGCGNGELQWEAQVRPLMEKYLGKLPIDVSIHFFKPDQTFPEHKESAEMVAWLRSEPKNLGFSEVWNDLAQIIGLGLTIETPSLKQSICFFLGNVHEDGCWFKKEGVEQFLPSEKLMEFWNILRTNGYCMKQICPSGLEDHFEVLLQLFSRLPYCRAVKVAQDYKSLAAGNLGLQLVAPMKKQPHQEKFFEVHQQCMS